MSEFQDSCVNSILVSNITTETHSHTHNNEVCMVSPSNVPFSVLSPQCIFVKSQAVARTLKSNYGSSNKPEAVPVL